MNFTRTSGLNDIFKIGKWKKSELERLIKEGHEIEFEYERKKYSITYGEINGEDVISFCEFYKESVEVKTFEELLAIRYNDFVFGDIVESLPEDKVYYRINRSGKIITKKQLLFTRGCF